MDPLFPNNNNIPTYLIHGWNVWDGGKSTVGKLTQFIPNSIEWKYGLVFFFVALLNDYYARKLAREVTPGAIGVGHSNGCAILAKAVKDYNAPLKGLVFINPALDNDFDDLPGVQFIHVYHSYYDVPTKIAGCIPFHPWGPLGNTGYIGSDPRFTNYDITDLGHSELFDDNFITHYGTYIQTNIDKELNSGEI